MGSKCERLSDSMINSRESECALSSTVASRTSPETLLYGMTYKMGRKSEISTDLTTSLISLNWLSLIIPA